MTVDEIDLMRQLKKDVGPVPAEASGRAKLVLRAAMAVDGPETATADMGARRHRRRSTPRALGVEVDLQMIERSGHAKRQQRAVVVRGGVAAGAAAAVAALALVAVSSPGHATKLPVAASSSTSLSSRPSKAPVVSKHAASPLFRLAAAVNASPTPAGDATLVARTTALGGGKSVTVYDLYTDNGQYYFSRTESGLAGQVNSGDNLAGGLFAREVAAAKLAATGNVRAAGEDMAAAPDPTHYIPQTTKTTRLSGADATKPGAYPGEVVGTPYDNYVWENAQDALIAGSGDPQVRAGVLRILATLPDVTVTPGTSADRATLVLTAGTAEVGAGYSEQLTINATTGIPVSSASGPAGRTLSPGVTYHVSRVTTSAIAAGNP